MALSQVQHQMFRTVPLGAPGVYVQPVEPPRVLRTERLDVCGFAGIAPRGPCREPKLPEWWREEEGSFMPSWLDKTFGTRRTVPVPVESFEEYRRLFGGFEGPGRLPYAVAAFFENGGRRAYVARIVHDYGDDATDRDGAAIGYLDNVSVSNGERLKLIARNEGAWGNRLRAGLGFAVSPVSWIDADVNGFSVDARQWLPVGTLLRLHLTGAVPVLRFVSDSRLSVIDGERRRRIDLAVPLPDAAVDIEVVEADLVISDDAMITERLNGLGLSSAHPRWLAGELCYRSELVYPDRSWEGTEITPLDPDELPLEALLPPRSPRQFGRRADEEGKDRYPALAHEDFFDRSWSPAEHDPGDGIQAFAGHPEIAALAVPDLYCPEPLPDIVEAAEVVSFAGPEFEPCVEAPPEADPPLELPHINQLCLDPSLPADREAIVGLQRRVVSLADVLGDWIALLDVPPGLQPRQITAWRARFDSSYAAAYLPWLLVSRTDDPRDGQIEVNPSAVAAGIIARRELARGVPHGPANELAATVVGTRDPLSPAQHDHLHPLGLNAYVRDPAGIRLTAARTLSGDPAYRQLNVRRLMILMKRVLRRQTQWAVFEPNGPPLWRQLTRMLENFLLQLYRDGAFTGATPAEAFFVRCDEHTNHRRSVDAGRLVAEIGVAPSEPMEFIVLQIIRRGDSTLVREV